MTDQEQLLYLRKTCPALSSAAEDVALDASDTPLVQKIGDPLLPPNIILEMIQLMSSLLGFLLNGCAQVPPNPSPAQMQKFLTERPFLSGRGMIIRRAARKEWRAKGLRPERVGLSVDRKCQLLTGTSGLMTIQTAMLESKKVKKMFVAGAFVPLPTEDTPTDEFKAEGKS